MKQKHARAWKVLGSRGAKSYQRTIFAETHQQAVAQASKGTGFLLVQQCVLQTDTALDQGLAIEAFNHALQLGILE